MLQGTGSHLVRKRAVISAELSVVRRTIKRSRRTVANAVAATQTEWSLHGRLGNATVLMYALAGYDTGAPVGFLTRHAHNVGWHVKAPADICRIVEDRFLEMDTDVLEALRDESDSTDAAALHDAVAEVEQWRLASWVGAQNRDIGVAPTTAVLADRYEHQRTLVSTSVRPRSWGLKGSSAMRKRACRWRRKFGGRFGMLRPREHVPVAEARSKVQQMLQIMDAFRRPLVVTTLGILSSPLAANLAAAGSFMASKTRP